MKAILRFHEKYQIKNRYLVEIELYEVDNKKRYPHGVRYGLICIDLKTKKKVLMDNHHPKGDHIHIEDEEIPYIFQSPEKIIEDFKILVLEHLGVKL